MAGAVERIEEEDGWICEPIDAAGLARIASPILRDLHTYWDGLRGARVMPARMDINPAAIPSLISHVGMFEILDSGRAFRIRLLGSKLQHHMETDLTGQTLDGLSPGIVSRRVHTTIGVVVRHRCAYHMSVPTSRMPGKDIYSAEGVMLPLSAGGDSVRFALGSQILTPRSNLV